MFKSKRSGKNATGRRWASEPAIPTNQKSFLDLWAWFFPADMFASIGFHGNTKWHPTQLIVLAFCWTWSDARGLTDAFVEAAERVRSLFGRAALLTYQGFLRALVTWSPTFIGVLIAVVRQRMEEIGGPWWRIGGWVPIAFDGSRSTAPRTRSNEAAYCAANHGRGMTARYRRKKTKGMRRHANEKNPAQPPTPQVWLTLLWHVGLRLPWAWRIGPSNASERDHVMKMIQDEFFPKGTLFCGDAGFIGYPLWSQIQERGHDFLVRAGANVSLQVMSVDGRAIGEGTDQLVWCWPLDVQRAGRPSLRLRLIRTRIQKTKVWLLTSVLDRKKLPLAQAVRLYQQRWGIEVEFRGLKQTLNRAELRCRNADRLRVELDWSVLGMAVAELLALKEQLSGPTPSPKKDQPAQRSLAGTMRALRWCLRNLDRPREQGRSLPDRLRLAVIDDYQRRSSKQARYRPPNPDKKPLGDPTLRVLTEREITKLQEIELNLAA